MVSGLRRGICNDGRSPESGENLEAKISQLFYKEE
jgi:hypothetical protein